MMSEWISGDKIIVGDITKSYAAIGAGASVIVNQVLSYAEQLDQQKETSQRELALAIERKLRQYADLQTPHFASGGETPYKALLNYTISDAHNFFGREEAIFALLTAMQKHKLTVLHAESGAGKTSLLQAGIAARLLANGHLPLVIRPNQRTPQLAIKQSLVPDIENDPLVRPLKRKGQVAFLSAVDELFQRSRSICILLDQFEEFFIHLHANQQHNFAVELGNCLSEPSLNVRWVIALRKEYFSDLHKLRPHIQDPFANEYQLARLTPAQALAAIKKPAEMVGIRYQPGVAEQIVKDLQSDESEHQLQITPPHLQIVCSTLVAKLAPSETMITEQLYIDLGGASAILKGQLRRVLRERLANYYSESIILLQNLVSSTKQRLQCDETQLLKDMAEYEVNEHTLDIILGELEASRILRREKLHQIYVYELAHDYLIDEIELNPELLAQKAAQELLEQEYQNWMRFHALLRPELLQVITAQRYHFKYLDTIRQRFILCSALAYDTDIDEWLQILPIQLSQAVLVELLGYDDWQIRWRSATYLNSYFNVAAEAPLQEQIRCDPQKEVRDAALMTLKNHNPALAHDSLQQLLNDSDETKRIEAAQQLYGFCDEQSAIQLYQRILADPSKAVQFQALKTLSSEQAVPFRQKWRPLRRIAIRHHVEVYHHLVASRIQIPYWFRLQTMPARIVNYVYHHPSRTVVQVAILILLYLVIAFQQGLLPFRRWEPYLNIPQDQLKLIEESGNRLYIGSFNNGLGITENKRWIGWFNDGLPTSKAHVPGDPTSAYQPIIDLAIASKSGEPDHLFVFIRETGMFESKNGGVMWQSLPAFSQIESSTQISNSMLTLDITVYDQTIVVASSQDGLINSPDLGKRWERLDGQGNSLPRSGYKLAAYDPVGQLYVSTEEQTYRRTAIPSAQWEKVMDMSITSIDFTFDVLSNTVATYVAIDSPATSVGCLDQEGRLAKLVTLGSDVVTTIEGDPVDMGIFYVAVLGGDVLTVSCNDGVVNRYRGDFVTQNIKDITIDMDSDLLIQVSGDGIYSRPR